MSAKRTIRFGIRRISESVIIAFVFVCGSAFGLVQSAGPYGSNARLVQQQGITGKGINIGLLSSGNVRSSHEAFALPDSQSVISNYDFSGKGVSFSSHDTQVAGIIVSHGGTGYSDCRGVAPGARFHSARISGGSISASAIQRALHELIVVRQCRIIVTGIQMPSSSVRPDGNSIWAMLYDYYAEHYDVVFANASGNGEKAVTVFGDGLNGITTGGLALDENGDWRITGSISNIGPTIDGRRKPELMAPAQRQMVPGSASDTAWAAVGSAAGQTSFAAPHTAGVAALLMEHAAGTETPFDDKSLTIKAVLVNSADPNLLGKSNLLTRPDENVWHPHRGFGRIDAARAFALLNAERILPDLTVAAHSGWAFEMLDFNARQSYHIEARKGQRLAVTLVWHRKLFRDSALSYVEEAPRLNLSLEVRSPNGTILFSESETENNLRKANLILPQDGRYTLLVRNQTYQQNREYALAFQCIDSEVHNTDVGEGSSYSH